MLRGVYQAYIILKHHEYYMILPALAISAAFERTARPSVQSCGFTLVSGSIRAIMECSALEVKGNTWRAALKVRGASIQ